jgi:hypothetical protein
MVLPLELVLLLLVVVLLLPWTHQGLKGALA